MMRFVSEFGCLSVSWALFMVCLMAFLSHVYHYQLDIFINRKKPLPIIGQFAEKIEI